MRTIWMMMTMLSVWALPVQAERKEEQPAVQMQDTPRLVMSVQLSEADRARARHHAPAQGTGNNGRPALRKLGPAPKVQLTAERIADAVRSAQAKGRGDVLTVDCTGEGDHTTIQTAIDAASDGDVIIVLPNTCTEDGHYFENINFLGKAITVQSLEPTNPDIVSATVIDGSTNDLSTVTFASAETAESVLDGLTVTGGSGTPNVVDPVTSEELYGGGHVGGGIFCVAASPTIRRCRVVGNVTGHGGGIGVVGLSHPQISHSLIEHNTAQFEASWFGTGGGVSILDSSATIRFCTIQGNVAYHGTGEPGGGPMLAVAGAGINFISIRPATALHVNNCVIRENVTEGSIQPGGPPPIGGGLFAWGALGDSISVFIKNSLIVDNFAAVGGGLLFYGAQLVPSIEGCTIAGNSYLILISDQPDELPLLISNTIVYDNQPPNENAILAFFHDPRYSYCDVETVDGSVVPGAGNINADPLFVDSDNGDYHLTSDSPCVEAGDPDFEPEEGETDIDGEPRVVGERVDMGADEFLITCDGDFDLDGAVGPFDLALLLGNWGPCDDPDDCPADLDGDGAVGPFDLALVLGNWGPCP